VIRAVLILAWPDPRRKCESATFIPRNKVGRHDKPKQRRERRHEVEIVVIPVSDVDRAKEFYGSSGGGSTPTSAAVKTSA
jgi:hypothetical protein